MKLKKNFKKIFQMHVDLEKIKKLPPDVKKDFYKMYLKYTEKKHEAKVRGD